MIEREPDPQKALVVRVHLSGREMGSGAMLAEAVELARALDLIVVDANEHRVARPVPATLLGTGLVALIAEKVEETGANVVVIDSPLTPVQQRNLERALKAKVVDRTGLILEIFARRARTKEGTLQVELARLEYERSRLVRTWTHLERQRGGRGFLAGPGERQIESDRRMLAEKIGRLKRDLEDVGRTRDVQRAGRKREGLPVIALVGYTNAGKSTLFNRLTGASVLSKDMLFATLDPTMRAVALPTGRATIWSDTVGFIRDLPTELVAAFRGTLEEVINADLILHVRDVSDPDWDAHKATVMDILKDLTARVAKPPVLIEVWNKVDRLEDDEADITRIRAKSYHDPDIRGVCVTSSLTGEGLESLLAMVDILLTGDEQIFRICIPFDTPRAVAFVHRQGDVLEEGVDEDEEAYRLRVCLSEAAEGRFRNQFPGILLEPDDENARL